MGIGRLLNVPVLITFRTEGAVDDDGEPTVTTDTFATEGHISQSSTNERGDVVVSENLRLFLPASTPLDPWDSILVDGRAYEVDGQPWSVVNARTGAAHHIEVDLRRGS